MTHKNRFLLLLGIVVFTLGVVLTVNAAETAEELDQYVIGAGGSGQGNLGVTLDYTLGQPVTGEDSTQGFDLCAGYWCDPLYQVYLPMLVRMSS